ncbi:hypothetical protein SESBI_34129 [Sesbania bispinosa]|nr:hypothetical protein SESBI_34129 [Sesbania bispinosa]
MGFGNLLHVDCMLMGLDICLELVNRFDTNEKCLHVAGRRFDITAHDVGYVLGIPCEGKLFNLEEDVVNYSNDVNLLRGKKSSDLRAMLGMKSGSSHFRRAFILFVLATFLCSTSKDTHSSKLLPTIIDVKNPSDFNWGQLVLDWLVEEIIVFKKDVSKRSIGGCMYFLQMFYFNKCPIPSIVVTNEAPLIKHWRNENIQQRILYERKNDQGNLLAISKTKIDPIWVKNVFKHEVYIS